MIRSPFSTTALATTALLVAQLAVGTACVAFLAFAPPARGAMLLVPLTSGAQVARLAREGDAMLLAQGPGEGLVVQGQRAALFWPLLRAGVLTMAAPRSLCGETR